MKKLVFFIMMVAVVFIFAEVKIVLKSGEVIKVDVDPSQIAQIVFVPQQNYILYEKTFNNLGDWKIGGRQEGVNKWEITNFKGEPCLHIHHEEFSEIKVQKIIEIPEYAKGKEIIVEVKAAGSVHSLAGDTSDFYASASIGVILKKDPSDSSNPIRTNVAFWTTSTYPIKYTESHWKPYYGKNIRLYDEKVWKQIKIVLDPSDTVKSKYILIYFKAYGSGWPYDLKADLWVNHIKVYVSQ